MSCRPALTAYGTSASKKHFGDNWENLNLNWLSDIRDSLTLFGDYDYKEELSFKYYTLQYLE
jgi:hypothetical protein